MLMYRGPARDVQATRPLRCSFCGTDAAGHFITGRTATICDRCVIAARLETQPDPGTHYDLCGNALVARVHLLSRRRVTPAAASRSHIACSDCLATCREILAETLTGPA